jgi:hypothetical protein
MQRPGVRPTLSLTVDRSRPSPVLKNPSVHKHSCLWKITHVAQPPSAVAFAWASIPQRRRREIIEPTL